MFPIRITTLVTEEVYQRFAWSVFLRGKRFLLNIIILIGILSLYLIFLPDNLKRFSFFTVLFISLVTFSAMYFGMNYQIKRAYQKNPLFQNMEVTLIFDREAFIARNIRGEFRYTYDDIVKVIMTKQDFYILIGENTGFAIEKRTALPRLLNSC